MAPAPYPLDLLTAMAAAAKPVYVGTERWQADRRRERNRAARKARRIHRGRRG